MIGELKALDLVTEGLADTQSRLGRPTHAVSLSGDGWVVAGLRVDVDGIQAKTATVGGDHLGSYADRADLRGGDPSQAIRMLAAAIEWIVESVDPPRSLTAVSIAVAGRVSHPRAMSSSDPTPSTGPASISRAGCAKSWPRAAAAGSSCRS